MALKLTSNQIDERIATLSPDEVREAIASYERLSEIRARSGIVDYVPNPIQKPFHDSTAKERVLFGANAVGKTVAGAKEAVCYLLGEDPSGTTTKEYPTPPNDLWACSPRTDMAMNILLPEIMFWLPKSAYDGFDKKQLTLHTKNGSACTLRSFEMDISAWQGKALNGGWCDEQPPFQHYMELRSRVNRRLGDIWTTMTPIYAHSSWTHTELLLPWRDGSVPHKLVECFIGVLEDNIYLSAEMMKRQHDAFDGRPDEAARLRGEHMALQGRIFNNYNPSEHFVDAEPVLEMLERDRKGEKLFKYARVMDVHPRAPDICIWFAYNEQQPLIYVIQEFTGSPEMYAGDLAAAVIAESESFSPTEFTLCDTPESDSDAKTGVTIRSIMGPAGLPTSKPKRDNYMLSRDIFLDYIRVNAFRVLRSCPHVNRALQSAIWAEWQGNRRFEDAPKEKPKKTPDTCYTDCVRYFFRMLRPLSFNLDARSKLGNQVHKSHRYRAMHERKTPCIQKNFQKPLAYR